MIKKMIWPLIKKFKGLFISMAFVSMISIALLIGFTNTLLNVSKSYDEFVEKYNAPSVVVTTNFHENEEDEATVKGVEGVNIVDHRLTINAYMKKNDGRVITSRIFTYKDSAALGKFFVVSSAEVEDDKPVLSIDKRFADNNKIKAGDTVSLGYFGFFYDFKIKEVVESPETIYVRASDYIRSDNTDFGTLFIKDIEVANLLFDVSSKIVKKMDEDESFQKTVEDFLKKYSLSIPDLKQFVSLAIANAFVNTYSNQILVKNNKGANNKSVAQELKTQLEAKGFTVSESKPIEETTSDIYMRNSMKQVRIAALFLPIFFYTVALFIIVLFINQIIKMMTSDIGIMMSIGIQGKEITGLFSIFIFLMTVVASVFGIAGGYGILAYLSTIMKTVYSLPYVISTLSPWLVLIGTLSLIVVGQIAITISSANIYRITPKDAMLSNETKRKHLPKWLAKAIDKLSMSVKLSVNSIAQNTRRFFVSTFSIFASFVIILLVLAFRDSKGALINQSVEKRLNFDCQVYLTEKLTKEKLDEIKSNEYVTGFLDGHFTYLEFQNGNKTQIIQALGIDVNRDNDMIYIPSNSGKSVVNIQDMGLILPRSVASALHVKKGDTINIKDYSEPVTITDISYQYSNQVSFMSKSQLDAITSNSVSTLFLNTNNEVELLNYLSTIGPNNISVFSSSLADDMKGRLSSIDVFIFMLIAFALGMAFIILTIMTQNSLLDQKRPISVMRSVGFTVMDVSNLWMLQSISQLILSTIFAVPSGYLAAYILFKLASSTAQLYPLVFNPFTALFSFLFIVTVIGISHLFSMNYIARWNLADNTRSRE